MWTCLGFSVEEGEVMWYEECVLCPSGTEESLPHWNLLEEWDSSGSQGELYMESVSKECIT